MKTNITKIILTAIAIVSAVFPIRAEREYQSICKENRVWIYSEFYPGRQVQHKVFTFNGTTEIDGYTYYNCYAYNYEKSNNGSACLMAYLRQEDGKVYMLKSNIENILNCPIRYNNVYGSDSDELLIYDFTLNIDDEFHVGEKEDYRYFISDRLSNLLAMATDYGRISCKAISYTNCGDRVSKKMELEFIEPEPDPDALNYIYYKRYCKNKSFIIQEGIGLLSNTDQKFHPQGYMPFPYTATMSESAPYIINLLYVCDVEDINGIKEGNFGNVIYRQDGMPENPKEYFDTLAVDEIRADEDAAPVYFNIQGMQVSNPTEGEIYIVKRASKATKEVYRR